MTVIPIHPDNAGELFDPHEVWGIFGVYHRPTDNVDDVLLVEAGWNQASGPTVRLGHHEFSRAQALEVVSQLGAAIAYLDARFKPVVA